MKKILMFSLITGEMYEIEEDELKVMDKYQLPLIKRPSPSCNKCYGRLYDGFNPKTNVYNLCPKCMNKCIDYTLLQKDYIEGESFKHD